MRTPFGRVRKLALLLVAVLAAAWFGVAVLVALEIGVRTTPLFGKRLGGERRRR